MALTCKYPTGLTRTFCKVYEILVNLTFFWPSKSEENVANYRRGQFSVKIYRHCLFCQIKMVTLLDIFPLKKEGLLAVLKPV